MPRPPRQAVPASKAIIIRLTPAERDLFKAKAAAHAPPLSLSDFIRLLAFGYIPPAPITPTPTQSTSNPHWPSVWKLAETELANRKLASNRNLDLITQLRTLLP